MRNWVYTYKTSDGLRHEGEMEAPSKDDVYTELRRQGIRAIRVDERIVPVVRNVRKRTIGIIAGVSALCAAVLTAVLSRSDFEYSRISERPGCVKALIRRDIGNIAPGVAEKIFRYPAESYLALFAEPGVAVDVRAEAKLKPGFISGFSEMLDRPITVDPLDEPWVVEYKRIVVGMEDELRLFLASGGGIRDYAARLMQRQVLEISFREKARNELTQAMRGEIGSAYVLFRRLNTHLESMGIAPLEMPQRMRDYVERSEISGVDVE